jgi:hypothetical protein
VGDQVHRNLPSAQGTKVDRTIPQCPWLGHSSQVLRGRAR